MFLIKREMIFSTVLLLLLLQDFGNCEPWKFGDISKVHVKISDTHPFSYDLDEETGTWYDCSCGFGEDLLIGPVFTERENSCCKFVVHLSNLEAIGKILAKFSNLQKIHLDFNIYEYQLADEYLKLEPEVIQNLSNVTRLSLQGFNVSTDFLKNFDNLKELDVQRSNIRKENSSIQAESLETIALSSTKLDNDEIFGKLSGLRKLKVEFSPSLKITGKLLGNMENLLYLEIQSLNELSVPVEAFDNLINLRELHIQGNQNLEKIEKGTFKNLSKLHYLYLKNSYKLDLTGEEFEGLIHLKELDISFNDLKSLDGDKILKFLPELKILNIKNFFPMDSPQAVKAAQLATRLKEKRPNLKIITQTML